MSARKHGVADADMLHAVVHYEVRFRLDEEVTMYIGPPRSWFGLLEIAVVDDRDGTRIIHAMKARRKFLP